MTVDEFVGQFGSGARGISDVMREWQFAEIDGLLRTLHNQGDDLIGSAVVFGDALHGDGMLDQIPGELRDAFVNLMHEKAASYEQMRQILLDHIRADGGGYLPFDSPSVVGFVSKLKGQIGENLFKHHAGGTAMLAESGSQEAWDVAVKQADDAYKYVQVKLYASPHDVVRHMLKVQEKVANGWIEGCTGDTVHQIDFAVPADIAERVNELKDHFPQLDSLHVLTIPINADQAAGIVTEGMSNVGPDQLSHFFHELLGGAVAAGSLHAIVHGFHWYKGSKDFAEAFSDAAAGTAISVAGIGMGLAAETLCHAAMLSGAIGIGGRVFLGRVARSRWNFVEFLESSIAQTQDQAAELQRLFRPIARDFAIET